MANPEVPENSPLEERRQRLEWYEDLDSSGKKAFDSLSWLKWGKDKLTTEDISLAIDSTMQKGIANTRFKEGSEWLKRANEIREQMLVNLKWKNPQQMVQEYAKFRTELISILWTENWSKWQKIQQDVNGEKNTQIENEQKKFDFMKSAQEFWNLLLQQSQENRETAQVQKKQAQTKWSKEAEWAREEAFNALSKWPK